MAALEETGSTTEAGVVDNTDQHRFELRNEQGEVLSFADYRVRENTVIIPHVETAHEHRGQGNAARLMAGVVENLRATERTVNPLCPYAAGYLRDRPETHDVLAVRS